MSGGSVGGWIYKLLLRVFPPPFRRRWGAEMETVFHHRLREAKTTGGSRVWVWIRSIADVATQAPAEWFGRGGEQTPQVRGRGHTPLATDLRHALKATVDAPIFTLIAVSTLALGIGVSTAGYSVMHGVLMRALPYRQPDRLVVTWPERNHNKSMIRMSAEAIPALESVSGIAPWTFTLTGQAEPMEVVGAAVSTHHFAVLGVQPALGRTFDPSESQPGHGAVVILSHGLWERVFGSDPEVLGRIIDLSGHGHERRVVIGVMPPGLRPVFGAPQLWVPLEVDPALPFEADDSWYVNRRVARLAPGANLDQANQQMRAFALRLRERAPDRISAAQAETSSVVPLRGFIVEGIDRLLWVVLGAVSLVLLVASANVASLLVVRGEARARELAIRVALGAGQWRIRRMLFVECGLLGLAGGSLGVLLTFGLIRAFAATAPPGFPRVEEVGVDGPVLLFVLAATLTSTLLAGLVPSIRAARADAAGTLCQSQRSACGTSISRLSTALVGIQVALAACVAVGSGLMLRSLEELLREDPGLDASGVVTFRPNPPGDRYPDAPRTLTFYESVLTRLRALPEVESAGAIHLLPGTGGTWNFPTFPEGVEYPEGTPPTSVNFRAVLPGYFETVRIPLIQGRYLESSDRGNGERVVVVNRAFANLFWFGEDPLGKTLRLFEPDAPAFRVVGVVGDVRQHSRAESPRPEMYFSAYQYDRVTLWLMVRFRDREPLDHARAVKAAVWSVDENVPVTNVQEFSAVMRSSTRTTSSLAMLLSAFCVITLALGAVSVLGVTSHTAGRRRAEYGVRIALGASRWTLLCSSVAHSLTPAVVGVAAGLALASALSGIMESLVYGVKPMDTPTLATVAIVLLGTAALASAIPAWRACNVDPVRVLNSE
jgi:putative ABC transport system permease protein